ncbi:Peptidase A1 domain-containing protein [Aphelenchoides besseyi]|nr:Peptidase A1 domain-containing protein [Aphelenchoides besseyi]
MNGKLLVFISLVFAVDAKPRNSATLDYSASGPYFTLPLKVGSQRTQLSVGIDGYYGAPVIYSPSSGASASFDRSRSSTWTVADGGKIHDFEFSQGTGHGPAGNDYWQVGDLPPLTSAMFGNPDTVSYNGLYKLPQASGFIAMWAAQDDPEQKTEMQLIVEKAARPVITFHAPSDLYGTHSVVIGMEDTTRCRNNWVSLPNIASLDVNNRPWTASFSSFAWGSYKKNAPTTVAFNIAADYFVGPKVHVNYMYNALGAQYSSRYSGGVVSCSKMSTAPDLVFTVKGKQFSIKASQYIKRFDSSTCLFNVYPDELNWWTLPYQFHQNRCIKYDYATKTINIADEM